MQQMVEERRAFQRLTLETPIVGTFAGFEVQILELGVIGARISIPDPLPRGTTGMLTFSTDDQPVEIEAEVARISGPFPSPEGQVIMPQAGLRFSRSLGETDRGALRLLRSLVRERLSLVRADPAGDGSSGDDDTERARGFMTYAMVDGEWVHRSSLLPDQPKAGFTVPAGFDGEELAHLQQAYEDADVEGMHLIRLFAELSVYEAAGMVRGPASSQ